MKMMRGRRSHGAVVRVLVAGALSGATLVAPLVAQNRGERQDCRCVDSAGDPIPDCSCFRHPSPQSLAIVMARSRDHARLGITVNSHQSAAVDAEGARVQSVLDGGPAAQAGIREGDIITRVDGKSLLSPLDPETEKGLDLDASVPVQRLLAIARELKPDTKVPVTYVRDGDSHTTTVETRDLDGRMGLEVFSDSTLRVRMRELRHRLGRLSDSLGDSTSAPRGFFRTWIPDSLRHTLALGRLDPADRCPGNDSGDFRLFNDDCVGGLRLVALNPGLGSYFGTSDGVLVGDVRESSPIGLQAGDVILEIGSREVTSPDQVRRILRSYGPDETISFKIMRKGKTMNVSGRLPTD